jgi:hypothetical protein
MKSSVPPRRINSSIDKVLLNQVDGAVKLLIELTIETGKVGGAG